MKHSTEDYDFLDRATGETLSVNTLQLRDKQTGESFANFINRINLEPKAQEELKGVPPAVERQLLRHLWHTDLDTPDQWEEAELKLWAAIKYGVPIVVPD